MEIIDSKHLIMDKNSCYSYDKIFIPETSQREIYLETSKELINSFINGYNGTIIVYGQTGSGKTYTMFGSPDEMGIIPQAVNDIFVEMERIVNRMKDIKLECSMYEIYK
jgi:type IV secretory pathway ATPase VirB11/archaellum biosynthesis ATPase